MNRVIRTTLLFSIVSVLNPALGDGGAIEQGRVLAADSNKGNCLSCHYVRDGEMTGNVAPALIQMKVRFPDKAVLRAQIWDATVNNPESVMPPYGRHTILTEAQIDLILEYVYSL